MFFESLAHHLQTNIRNQLMIMKTTFTLLTFLLTFAYTFAQGGFSYSGGYAVHQTSHTSSTGVNHGHYGYGSGQTTTGQCPLPMSSVEFNRAFASISCEPFSDDKMAIANQILTYNILTADQIARIVSDLVFSGDRERFAKDAWFKACDPQNYYMVLSAFTFSSSKRNVQNFISRNPRAIGTCCACAHPPVPVVCGGAGVCDGCATCYTPPVVCGGPGVCGGCATCYTPPPVVCGGPGVCGGCGTCAPPATGSCGTGTSGYSSGTYYGGSYNSGYSTGGTSYSGGYSTGGTSYHGGYSSGTTGNYNSGGGVYNGNSGSSGSSGHTGHGHGNGNVHNGNQNGPGGAQLHNGGHPGGSGTSSSGGISPNGTPYGPAAGPQPGNSISGSTPNQTSVLDFGNFINVLNSQTSESRKLSMAKDFTKKSTLSTNQIRRIMKSLSQEGSKLDYAKFAYRFCSDKQNFLTLANDLRFESSKRSLRDFIKRA